jgi:uncharacterized protein (DUF433 family)
MTIMETFPTSATPQAAPRSTGESVKSSAGQHIYRLTDAARLTQHCTCTVRRWALGTQYRHRGEIRYSNGMIGCAPRWIGGTPYVTFPQLLSFRVVKGLRLAGLSLKAIRGIALMAAAVSGEPTPLALQRFRIDGAHGFLALDHSRRIGAQPEAAPFALDPREAENWQAVFVEMIDQALFRDVDWSGGWAARWWPMGHDRSVALDPCVMGGMPHIAGTRVLTTTVASDMRGQCGGEPAMPMVAAAHGISVRQVRDAVSFEREWLAPSDDKAVRNDSSPAREAPSARRAYRQPSPAG